MGPSTPGRAGRSGDGPRILHAGDVSSLPVERATAVLPSDLIRDDEIVILLLRPSLLFIPLSCVGSLMGIAIMALVLAILAIQVQWVPWGETQAYALGAALAGLRLAWQVLEWYSRVYVLTDCRVIRRMGVLRVSVFETALKNIQHTSVFMSVRERVFGLGTIGFATAGSDVFDAFWVMLRGPFAVHRIVLETIQRYANRSPG